MIIYVKIAIKNTNQGLDYGNIKKNVILIMNVNQLTVKMHLMI